MRQVDVPVPALGCSTVVGPTQVEKSKIGSRDALVNVYEREEDQISNLNAAYSTYRMLTKQEPTPGGV